jgi:geranylgeranyl reductase family protein
VVIPSSGASPPSADRPLRCDVLVVGAGPAGAAAARVLSQSGLSVVLADQHAFPRDKVCGDALISDALGALVALGLRERVAAEAVHGGELRVMAPSGEPVPLAGEFACLARHRFDALLCEAACEAGARFIPGLTAVAPLLRETRVSGARFRTASGEAAIEAAVTLLGTGANATVLDAFGLDVPKQTDAVAGRAYFQAPPHVAAEFPALTIAFDRRWCPGYGWIFPSPGHRFNVGVGLFAGEPRRSLRDFWEFFTSRFAPAAAILRTSTQITAFRGAPMRTGLAGAQFGRPGLLAIGEAAAVTYSATGEGIGKAMESGLIAAAFAADVLGGRRALETAHDDYGEEFRRRFASRYRAYAVAQRWAANPFVLNLLAGRANSGCFARRELEALVAERGDPVHLFSRLGLVRALLR